jgi:magnesium chelatase family protein
MRARAGLAAHGCQRLFQLTSFAEGGDEGLLATAKSASVAGVDGFLVDVEVDMGLGLPSFNLVGLPDAAIKESRERVITAIRNCGFQLPPRRVTVNLAPADIRKEGASFDLSIALGILAASGLLPPDALRERAFVGELSLDGQIRDVKGVLPMAVAVAHEGRISLVVPPGNGPEATLVDGLKVYPIEKLLDVVEFLRGGNSVEPLRADSSKALKRGGSYFLDLRDVRGQEYAKRAMEVAAAGGHNLIMIGPPGSGKSMLATRLPTILPPMESDEALETTKIHSVAGRLQGGSGLVTTRPYRAPHHTVSDAGLIGGGRYPRPGEISLAHNGVLFLDELPEFRRNVMEALRQPLEEGHVSIVRARYAFNYPANFMLVAAMNPCSCGYATHPTRACTCTPPQVRQYLGRVSGPLMDRIDLHVEVPAVRHDDLVAEECGEPSIVVRRRVVRARRVQAERFKGRGYYTNSRMSPADVKRYCTSSAEAQGILKSAMARLSLSARAYHKILRVARTISDLEGCDNIEVQHMAEAIQYRSLDRETG